jgi:DNA-binding response OmpR family regulator
MTHVLLVEDDPAVLHVMQATLAFGGITSCQVQSATDALRRIKAESFDAILLDLELPGFAGPQLIQIIRAVSDSPLIAFSGEFDAATINGALSAGAHDFAAKPFMPRELLARIYVAIWRHAQGCDRTVRAEPDPSDSRPAKLTTIQAQRRGSMEDRLIDLLRSRGRELISSAEIIASVWGKEKKRTDRNLRVLVARTRSKLKAEGQAFEIINEHGRGYRLSAGQSEASQSKALEKNGNGHTAQLSVPLEPAD